MKFKAVNELEHFSFRDAQIQKRNGQEMPSGLNWRL